MAQLIPDGVKLPQTTRIAVVTSRFNPSVTEKLEAGALERLNERGLTDDQVVSVRVPGAIEIPLAVQGLLQAGCDAAVALGCVVRGETTHYESVCQSVERGLTSLSLTTGKPIAQGVLTTENGDQAHARAGGDKGHKGIEAVDVVIEMLQLQKLISERITKR